MKKRLLLLLFSSFIFSGCNLSVSEPIYFVGSEGQAGGIIFYDCDADNNLGNSDGLISDDIDWRFLEAAPGDLIQESNGGIPRVNHDEEFRQHFRFGYYRYEEGDLNRFVNISNIELTETSTKQGIGEGKKNTELLVAAMGDKAYKQFNGGLKDWYAAKLCEGLDFGGYSDWFLPSYEELKLLFLHKELLSNLDPMPLYSYWSSSEGTLPTNAYQLYFISGINEQDDRAKSCGVRTIRRFK